MTCFSLSLDLIYCGRKLRDDQTLDFYGIQSGSTVHVLRKSWPEPDQKPGEEEVVCEDQPGSSWGFASGRLVQGLGAEPTCLCTPPVKAANGVGLGNESCHGASKHPCLTWVCLILGCCQRIRNEMSPYCRLRGKPGSRVPNCRMNCVNLGPLP